MGFRQMVFANRKAPLNEGVVNTILGNSSAYIADKAALAALTGLTEADIPYFGINGTDVEARIIKDYTLGTHAIKNFYDMTFYDDLEGKCLEMGLAEVGQFTFPAEIRYLNFPNCTALYVHTQWSMTGSRLMLTHINYPKMTNLGGTTGKNYMFSAIASQPSFIVHPSVVNDGDFTNARDSQSFRTVIATGTVNKPSKITDLTLSNSYAFVSEITHSPITTALPIESYFVYINGVYNQCVRHSPDGNYITGLSENTTYLIKVIAIDTEFNRSEFSNEVSVTTAINQYSGSYSPEYTAMLDYAVANSLQVPSVAQRTIDNQRILNLKTEGIWNTLDLFYYFNNNYPPIPMNHNFYIINWKAPSLYYLRNSSGSLYYPDFKTNKGFYTSAAQAKWFQTNFRPATNAVNLSKNDVNLGWKLIGKSTTVNQSFFICGARNGQSTEQIYTQHTGTTYYMRMFGIDANGSATYAESNNYFTFNDIGNAKKIYMDGVLKHDLPTGNVQTGGLEPFPLAILGNTYNDAGAVQYQNPLDIGIQWLHFGASLEGKVSAMNNILKNTY